MKHLQTRRGGATGVILAAGRGTRLQALGNRRPKALLRVAGQAIIDSQINALANAGIRKVVVVVGHHSQLVRTHLESRFNGTEIKFVHNPNYRTTNNFVSLGLGLSELGGNEAALVINGDVAVEPDHFLDLSRADFRDADGVFLVDSKVWSEDAMKIISDPGGIVKSLSKSVSSAQASCVSADTYLLVPTTVRKFATLAGENPELVKEMWVESVIDREISSGDLGFQMVEVGSAWFEIDTPEDLYRANIELSRKEMLRKEFDNYIFDLDGTLVQKEEPLGTSIQMLDELSRRGKNLTIVTNNTSQTVAEVHELLRGLGFTGDITVENPLNQMVRWLRLNGQKSIFPILNPSVSDWLFGQGIKLENLEPQLVVVGYCTELTYSQLVQACEFVNSGVPYVGTHSDMTYPGQRGPIPDVGVVLDLIQSVTGVSALKVFGKPDPEILSEEQHEMRISHTLLVGDRLKSDMALGKNLGCLTALVLPEPPNEVEQWLEIFELVDFIIPSADTV